MLLYDRGQYTDPAQRGADRVTVIADYSITAGANFAAGANEHGYHFVNVNYPRDFDVTLQADFALATDGMACSGCKNGSLHAERAIELGHCFKLGTRYSEPANLTYLDANGREQLVVMGSYGIGLDRLMAAIIEAHHDEHGIVWPQTVAPYDVHLVALGKQPEIKAQADALYAELQAAGRSVLYDDRAESAGVKFTDADLIGVPLRVTLSKRSLQAGGVEVKRRDGEEREIVPMEEILQ